MHGQRIVQTLEWFESSNKKLKNLEVIKSWRNKKYSTVTDTLDTFEWTYESLKLWEER